MRFNPTQGKRVERAKGGTNMKKVIAFIVFSSITCVVAAVSALGEHVRKFVHHCYGSFAGKPSKSGTAVFDAIVEEQPLK